jgi:proline iminopeptidase
LRAARDWCAWEDSVVSQEEYGAANPYGGRAEHALVAFVRICSHYSSHYMWLEDNALFRNVDRLAGIPGMLLHGQLDVSGPAIKRLGTQPGLAGCPPEDLRRVGP